MAAPRSRAGIAGAVTVIANLQKVSRKSVGALKRGLFKAGMDVLGDAQQNAPAATGNLKGSGYVISRGGTGGLKQPNFSGDDGADVQKLQNTFNQSVAKSREILRKDEVPSVMVAFGAFYSVFVEETHATRGKFLRRALMDNKAHIRKVVADEIKKAL